MLDAGADIDAKGYLGRTPLMTAAEHGHSSVVKVLLEHGAGLERRLNGETALFYAARSGSLECVRLLLEHGADLEAATPAGDNALSVAYANHNAHTMLHLLECGVPIPKAFKSGTTRASLRKHAEWEIRKRRNRKELEASE